MEDCLNRIPTPYHTGGNYWKLCEEVFCLRDTEVSYIREQARALKYEPTIMTVNYLDWRWEAEMYEIGIDESDLYLVDSVTGQLFQKGVCMSNPMMTLEA